MATNIMQVFNYIFYRTAKIFIKRDGSDAYTAIGVVSIVQFLMLGDLITIVARMFFSLDEIASFKWPLNVKYIAVVIVSIMYAGNFFLYRRKYWNLSSYWGEKETSFQRTIRGWLVVLAILLTFVVMILLGTVFGRK